MPDWPVYLQNEAHLNEIERKLADNPEDVALKFERATALQRLGRFDQARDAYIALLSRVPNHFGALHHLGTLLLATGFRSAAETLFVEAVKQYPDNAVARMSLANVLFLKNDFAAAKVHYEASVLLDQDLAEAHQGLARVLTELGDERAAQVHRALGYQRRPVITAPYHGNAEPVRVLVLASAMGGEVPIQSHLDNRIFATTVVIVDYFDLNAQLPEHQLIFNAIGDADLCQSSLDAAEAIIAKSTKPVINNVQSVRQTGRVNQASRLAGIPGVIAPRLAAVNRVDLVASDAVKKLASLGFEFPLLLRSPGYHTGRNFEKVDRPEELRNAIEQLPGDELLVIQHLDARRSKKEEHCFAEAVAQEVGSNAQRATERPIYNPSCDASRKYRVMMVDGEFFPIHVAISSDWKVHYFSADMAENQSHRDEDAAFLNNMWDVLGPTARSALMQIRDMLDLEYAGIDFGLNRRGELLLFEANASMVVLPPGNDPRWDYRRAPIQRVFDAVRKMLVSRI